MDVSTRQVPLVIARTVRRAGDSWFLAGAAAVFLAQQLAISYLGTSGVEGQFRRVFFFASTILLVLFALRFRRFWGAWLVAAGIVLNLVPMAAHGGSMPIDFAVIEESGAFPEVRREDIGRQTNHGKDVVLERDDIHFFALSDRYVVELPGYGANIYSLGDFVLFAAVGLILLQAPFMVLAPRRANNAQTV